MASLRRLAGLPGFWAFGYAVWGITLYFASAMEGVPGPKIPHLDKVEHALFFAAGHLVLGLALALRVAQPTKETWWRIGVTLVITAGIVGVLDEFHQTFTPGRSGNDPGDIAADVLGGIIAAFSLPNAWKFLQQFKAGKVQD